MAAADTATEERKAVFNEIATVAFADGKANGGPKITAINGVWVEQSLRLITLIRICWRASSKLLSLELTSGPRKAEQVRTELNKWVLDHTNGLIKDLLPPGSVISETDKVYGNALYFKGAWEDKFSKSETKDRDFHLLNGTSVSVPFMSSSERQYVQICDGFKVLKLPFRQGLDIKRNGLDNLVSKMTSTPGFVDDHNPRRRVKVGDFAIPKFKISFGLQGSTDVFEELTILEECVSKALYHKACVEIDEEGAEAAAATAFAVNRCRDLSNKVDFVADHPFLFLIREDTMGTVLFAGQIFDPSQFS
ncbi:hypothetical protein Bca52824_031426 [Brassica carinata]|uniref:Serpin domain-containing protein n=1 Tax=Brassica carinata TaxID=52824 RepID=A0A8X7V470_BRACI|nr:hypothetical protein Bca52824_031426 [Brassica carinata]